jgi:hypothetical protein
MMLYCGKWKVKNAEFPHLETRNFRIFITIGYTAEIGKDKLRNFRILSIYDAIMWKMEMRNFRTWKCGISAFPHF